MEFDELKILFGAYDIRWRDWGNNGSKTIDQLASEIREGECYLDVKDGRIHRVVGRSVQIKVFFRDPGDNQKLQLIEDRQVMSDGFEKRRGLKAVGEKLLQQETYPQAIRRTFQEELGIVMDFPYAYEGLLLREGLPSESYPGTLSTYRIHCYRTWITSKHFKAEGYVEKQSDKTSYFVWKPVK